MFRIWDDYLTDPDFFIPAMFICMSIAMILKFLYWNRKSGWAVWSITLLLDVIIIWICGCCVIQKFLWYICWPTLPMGIWGAVPYAVFCLGYALRRKSSTDEVELK